MGLRLVLDTSVMVAALRSDRGASRRLLVGALSGRFTLLVSVPLMVEYQSVLVRPEHLEAARVLAGDVDGILSALAAVIERVRLAYLWRPLLRDPADEMVLETAVNGGADLLCTLNIRDFEPAKQFGMLVLKPGEAWRRVEEFYEKK